jgi:tetratricopeptide (TPR) repeat protein
MGVCGSCARVHPLAHRANASHVFYIAQSYRDLGNLLPAIEWYERRAGMGGWEEEVWYARYQVARLQHRLGLAWPIVLDAYLTAYGLRPTRLEPLFHVAKFYRETQQYAAGYLFSRAIVDTPYPEDILFVERTVYDYELPLEYAICCHHLGKHEEAIRVSDAVLARPDLPDGCRAAARQNRELSGDALRSNRSPLTS